MTFHDENINESWYYKDVEQEIVKNDTKKSQ